MAQVVYNVKLKALLDGTFDFETADIRVLLLEANTDINPDDANVGAVLGRAGTTELTSSGYSRQALASQTVTQDDVNNKAVFDAADVTFSTVDQAASETVTGVLVFVHDTDDAGSTPLFFDDTLTGLPLTPNGSDITITWHADGIITLAKAA